jgi:hypothetical protein
LSDLQSAEGEIATIRWQLMQQRVDHAQAGEPQRRVIVRPSALESLPSGVQLRADVWAVSLLQYQR